MLASSFAQVASVVAIAGGQLAKLAPASAFAQTARMRSRTSFTSLPPIVSVSGAAGPMFDTRRL
jgi:hypothetical protein